MQRGVGSTVLATVLIAGLALGALVLIARPAPLADQGSPAESAARTGRSAVEACNLPSSDPKAGGRLNWRLVVRADSSVQSDLLFVSGWTRLLCTATRKADGSFGAVTTAMGGDPGAAPAADALTYETGSEPAQGADYPSFLIVGRMPAETARIEIVTSDGEVRDATLGDGWYLARVAVGRGAVPTDIVAYDSSGRVIDRLGGPGGLQPGATRPAVTP